MVPWVIAIIVFVVAPFTPSWWRQRQARARLTHSGQSRLTLPEEEEPDHMVAALRAREELRRPTERRPDRPQRHRSRLPPFSPRRKEESSIALPIANRRGTRGN